MSKKYRFLVIATSGFVGFLLVASVMAYMQSAKKEPPLLTTNLDLEKKEIRENPSFLGWSGVPWPFSAALNLLQSAAVILADTSYRLDALANPAVKFVKIDPGMRKEEIAERLGKQLAWNEYDREIFASAVTDQGLTNAEGYFYPSTYLISTSTSPQDMSELMINRFEEEVGSRYASSTKKIINPHTALKIASIIEREAGGPHDMRLISGVIWNRVFRGMSLDMDATLQYAKGNKDTGWWPKVLSEDKYIDSPYNTYQNKGFPPTPISNPSRLSVEAALNPKKTDYLFYLHDRYGNIHPARTYKEHLANIKRYY